MVRKGEELRRDEGEVKKCAGKHIEGRFEGGGSPSQPSYGGEGGGIG